MKYLVLSFLMGIMAFCSKSNGSTADQQPLTLVDTNWQLVQFQPMDGELQAAQNDKATLWFTASNSIGGSTGCNSMGGDYEIKGDQLTVQAFSTKMYCEDVAAQEYAINEIMSGTMQAMIKEGRLVLAREKGQLIYKTMDKQAAAVPTSGGGAAPEQYDQQPATPVAAADESTQSIPEPMAAASEETTTEMTGLFRYMADAAVFQRCSDGSRYAVSMAGDFKSAEAYYNRMEKYGAAALMSFEVEVTKNTGEGLTEIITIQKVNSSSYAENCPD